MKPITEKNIQDMFPKIVFIMGLIVLFLMFRD